MGTRVVYKQLLAAFVAATLLTCSAAAAQDADESGDDAAATTNYEKRLRWPFGFRAGAGTSGGHARIALGMLEWKSFYWDVLTVTGIFGGWDFLGWGVFGGVGGTTIGYPIWLNGRRRDALRLGVGIDIGAGVVLYDKSWAAYRGPVLVPEVMYRRYSESRSYMFQVGVEVYWWMLVKEPVEEFSTEYEYHGPFSYPPYVAISVGIGVGGS